MKNRMKRLLALFASATLLMSGVVFPSVVQANPGDPFPAGNPIVFVAQTGSATNNTGTQLYEAIQGKNSVVDISPNGPIDPVSYNAMGFDQNNRYLYAIEVGRTGAPAIPYNNLVRIGQDGTTTVLGPVAGLPDASPSYNAGDMGGAGTPYANILFVRAGSNAAPDNGYLWLIDVTTLTATRVTLSTTVPNTGDLFWYAGYLWAVDGASNSGTATQTVDRISPAGVVDRFVIGNSIAKDTYGAQWIYGSGMVGILGNQTGKLYQIIIGDPTSASPSFTVVNTLSGPTTNGNDGASYPGEPVDLSITKTAPATFSPGSSLTYTITVTNNDPAITSTGYVVTDTLPVGLTDPTTSTEGAQITNSGGVQVLRYAGAPLAPGASVMITVTGDTSATSRAPIVNTVSVEGNENDPSTANNTATVTSTPEVTPVQANPDIARTLAGTPVSGNVLTDDSGIAITVTAHTDPLHGTVTIGTDGTYTYTPDPGFIGSDSFTYTITDENGQTSTAVVTIAVDPLPPVVNNTPPEIVVKRDTIYVKKGVVLTLEQILKIADVSIVDAEESIPLSRLDVTGYSDINWNVVNYPGTGYVISLETTDTPGLEAPIQQIAIFVEPADTTINEQNFDLGYPVDALHGDVGVGTDPGGHPIAYVPTALEPSAAIVQPVVPVVTSAPRAALPKTGDVPGLVFPISFSLGALALSLFAIKRRESGESEQVRSR